MKKVILLDIDIARIIEMHWEAHASSPDIYDNIRMHLKAGELRPDKEEYFSSFAYFSYSAVNERIYDFPL